MTTRNALTMEENFKLLDLIKEHRDQFDQDRLTRPAAAEFAQGVLGFPVTAANIKAVCQASGISWTSPRTTTPPVNHDLAVEHARLKGVVALLCEQLDLSFQDLMAETGL